MHTRIKLKRKRSWPRKGVFFPLGAIAIVAAIGARATPPALKITPLGGGALQLTVTNAVATNSYQIYYTPNFEPGYQWEVLTFGNTGQSNFTIYTQSDPCGFYQAVNPSDLDADGVLSWQDANDTNASIGILTVFIDTPTNHFTFR